MKKLLLIVSMFCIGTFLFMGQKQEDKPQKWSLEPQQTGVYDPSVISTAPLPQEYDYFNPNAVTRYISDPNGVYAVNPSIRVLPRSNSYQSEVIICRHPLNPLIMFGSSNAINNVSGSLFISEGVYVTTNGGANWFGSDTLQGSPIGNHGGDPGPTIDKNGNFIMTHLGFTTSGMYGNYSTNNGATWSSNFTIQSGSVDKNFAGTDDSPISPYYGRSYVVYTAFSSPYPGRISYTTNGGVSWSAPTTYITPQSGYINRAPDIRTAKNGDVYLTWCNTVGSSPEDFAGFAKSTNGGVTFTGTNNAFDMNGLLVFGTGFTPYGIRMNSFPRIDVDRSGGPRDGWIYIVVSQKNLAPAGSDPDIVIHRSTDGGATWSAGIRVNQDPLNNGKYQFYNAIRVDETGGVNVVYYDNRNTAADSAEVMLSRSIDGGDTWTDAVVSDHRFRPKQLTLSGVASGYAGDYIGITSGNGKVWPIWMDDITGVMQAWTTSVDLGPGISHTPLPNTEQLAGSYIVNCVITPSGSGINPSLTKLLWSRDNVNITDSLLMTNSSGNNWTANIPGNGSPATYRYYIKTTDSLSRAATSPAGAPSNLNLFVAQTDNTKPVITHTALTDQTKPNWPATITATVTDNLGLDSSWVVWYINSPSPLKQFKLINTSGNTFSAAFNSLNSDVAINDNIYYKIFAQDNSLAHNRDSTALYTFKIIDQVLCEDFTSATFAPTGWSLEFTGTQYWTRNAVSGYQTGTGSAKFDFWTASAGVIQSLVTLTFGNSIAGDSLKFDYSYAPYTSTSNVDSLIIETSTNAGSSYTTLARYRGATNDVIGDPLSMKTTAASGSSFTPTLANQWLTRRVALPAGTNKVKFRARSGFGNNLYLDNICKTTSFVAAVPSTITFAAQGYFDTVNVKLNIRDSATFYLRNIAPPYTIVDSGKSVVDSITASGTVTFANAQTGTYYVVVRGPNILETWSKSGGESYTRGTAFTYNFTTAATQAFGDNLILKGSRYCIYSGDVIKNNAIDLDDILQIYNAANSFTTGFNVNDLTGDRSVDLSDILIALNNSSNFVSRKAPAGANPVAVVRDNHLLYERKVKEINESRLSEEESPEMRTDIKDEKKILNR